MSLSKDSFPLFGYELLRDYLVPSILGKHEKDILYWAGKDLARKFPCTDIPLIISFFKDAGWGDLTLEKEMKDGFVFSLTNEPELLKINERNFRLEAGFIAEQIQNFKGVLTECYEEKKEKQLEVIFTVKMDLKEKIER
ncbi:MULTISPECIES: YslB family protein [Ureibacillus]|jgi:predicted hydrocarbon binding protein|uniref:Putative hydrocarbon binding protein n=1 Tax=Ureibacillus thermosphaericus TaxID=51173 RepID=A0A840PQD5_URETH|nr:YslB family protein [Ureibacillus thermosphaericus]MBB5148233.1 putative hydrocarbon binding protein [Ureibacillus thermosphaericus]NKZ31141.1 YslB family protein [Ureibacillus thermosphaericus]